MNNSEQQFGTADKSKEELLTHLEEIEREVRKARGDRVDRTPWDYRLPNGSDLKAMREECGLTVAEAAEIMNYAEQTLYQIEGGHKPPGREFIQLALRLYKREWPR